MALTVEEVINELKKYDSNKQVRVLFGMPTPILWLSHEDSTFIDHDEGCTLCTCDDIELSEIDRVETVCDLLWHLQFYKKDAHICHNDITSCRSYIEEVSDEVTDAEGNLVDIVFLISFAHMVG